MNLDLTEEHELLRRTVRDFADERVAPVAEELDREHRFPYELVSEMAELGLMGMTIPEEYGGAGTDTVSYAIAIEELTRVDSSVRGQAQPIYAASFLEEFVGEGLWAHVDVAGTAFFTWGRNDYLSQKGGTGYGVRLIAELATKLSA